MGLRRGFRSSALGKFELLMGQLSGGLLDCTCGFRGQPTRAVDSPFGQHCNRPVKVVPKP